MGLEAFKTTEESELEKRQLSSGSKSFEQRCGDVKDYLDKHDGEQYIDCRRIADQLEMGIGETIVALEEFLECERESKYVFENRFYEND